MSVEFSSDVCQGRKRLSLFEPENVLAARVYSVFLLDMVFRSGISILKRFTHFSGLTLAMWQARHRSPTDGANRRQICAAFGGIAEWTFRSRSILDQCDSTKHSRSWLVRTKSTRSGTSPFSLYRGLAGATYIHTQFDTQAIVRFLCVVWDVYAHTNITCPVHVRLRVSPNLEILPINPRTVYSAKKKLDVLGVSSCLGSARKPQKIHTLLQYLT